MADETLAARVRAKYPGVYDDLDDATLDRQVRAKFPGVYDDLPNSTADSQADTSSPSAASPPGTNSALALAGTVAAARHLPALVDATRTAVTAGLASPSAPRVIQKAIAAGVRGAATTVGGAIGGVPGAVVGATVSTGLTPTQQTIRGWLGREAMKAAASATSAAETGGDAVTNYITAMGGDATNLSPSAVEYATKAGRRILYDAAGRASLVTPTASAAETATAAAAPTAASATAGTVATILKKAAPYLETAAKLSGAQDLLAWAQTAEPNRRDIGFFGVGRSSAGNTTLQQPAAQLQAVQYLIDTKKLAPMAAARAVTGNNPQLADQLLTLYAQARAATK